MTRHPLTTERRIDIASRLQVLALDGVARLIRGREDVVFHGGTSIAAVHGSPRWSEDLDFMAAPGAIKDIFLNVTKLEQEIRIASSLYWPGAKIEVSGKTSAEVELGNVEKFTLRWEHPEVIGVIKIKVEFYACPEENLASYGARLSPYALNGRLGVERIRAASIHSIWGDKIVALAQRPVLKFRDVHDLGFLSRKYGTRLHQNADALLLALHASTGIYRRTTDEIATGLSRPVIRKAIEDIEGFKADMARWFHPQIYAIMDRRGVLDIYHQKFLENTRVARAMIADDLRATRTFGTLSC